MAYNPFNIFRRNQKALFAVLTVFIMIMFTLSSGIGGGADFFDWVSRWTGGKGGKEAVCKIDGSTITAGQLDGDARGLQFRRTIANRFMALAADETTRRMQAAIIEQQPRLSEQGRKIAQDAFQMLDMLRSPQFAPLVAPQLPRMADQVSRQADSPAMKAEDKEVAQIVRDAYLLHFRLAIGGSNHYFLAAPSKNRRDLIEFLLWEKKADQLGIRFTRDDVKRMIQSEFSGFFRNDVEVRKAMQSMQGFTMDMCLDAIGAEFRVRAAQSAVLGSTARHGGAPVFATPYEAFEYYREQCSPAIYEVIAVPAAAFVGQVPGEPTKTEINDLYKKHADDEPDPRKETPGFKEPRKIAINWFGVTGEEPYYKKLAEDQIKVGEALAIASGRLTVPLPGATGAWAITAAAPLTLKEPAVAAMYNDYVTRFKGIMRNEYSSSVVYTRDILEANWAKPGVAASAVGAFVGQSAGMGHPAAAASITMTAPIAYELRSRVAVGTPLVLGWVPSPGLLPTLVGASAASTMNEPKPLPVESMRPELIKSAINKRAKALAHGERPDMMSFEPKANLEKGDIERFIEELKKMSENDKPKDKALVEKYIAEFLAARGLTRGTSTAPRDEWTIEDDPNLAPLVKAQKESLGRARGAHGFGPDPYIPFGRSFFWRINPNSGRETPTTGLYLGEPFPPSDRSSILDENRPHYVYWRTEDIGAKKTTLSAAEPAVIAAWKRIKARDLAQNRANAMADAIRAKTNSDPGLLLPELMQMHYEFQVGIKDPKVQQRASRFTINGVCPLPIGPGGRPTRFLVPTTENIPYPTAAMDTALLENRDKPAKTVLVLHDAPKDVYYVATLMRRELKTPLDFKDSVYGLGAPARDILSQYQGETARKSRKSAVDLLKKEFRYEETEDQKKKLDENAKSGNRSDDF